MVANGQLENPIGTVELRFEVADFEFRERFHYNENVTTSFNWVMFLTKEQRNLRCSPRDIDIPVPFDAAETRNSQYVIRAPTALITDHQYTLRPQETLGSGFVKCHTYWIIMPQESLPRRPVMTIMMQFLSPRHSAQSIIMPLSLQIINFTDTVYTIGSDEHIADFTVLSPDQIKHIKPIRPSELSFMMLQDTNVLDQYTHELLKVPSASEQEEFWFPTTENPGDPTKYTPIQQRIYNELVELQRLENLNPRESDESRQQFLANFDGPIRTLNEQEKQQIEEILVEYNDIFARHTDLILGLINISK